MAQHVPIILPKPVIKDYFWLPNLIILDYIIWLFRLILMTWKHKKLISTPEMAQHVPIILPKPVIKELNIKVCSYIFLKVS